MLKKGILPDNTPPHQYPTTPYLLLHHTERLLVNSFLHLHGDLHVFPVVGDGRMLVDLGLAPLDVLGKGLDVGYIGQTSRGGARTEDSIGYVLHNCAWTDGRILSSVKNLLTNNLLDIVFN